MTSMNGVRRDTCGGRDPGCGRARWEGHRASSGRGVAAVARDSRGERLHFDVPTQAFVRAPAEANRRASPDAP
jgi:hypothetical protein